MHDGLSGTTSIFVLRVADLHAPPDNLKGFQARRLMNSVLRANQGMTT